LVAEQVSPDSPPTATLSMDALSSASLNPTAIPAGGQARLLVAATAVRDGAASAGTAAAEQAKTAAPAAAATAAMA
jgi:hypothetical protein